MPTDNNVTEKRSNLSPAKLALLEQRLRGAQSLKTASAQIPRRKQENFSPLSFAQQRLWFLNQMESGSAAYNISVALRSSGPTNLAALNKAIDAMVARHEILRTSFTLVRNEPVQIINPAAKYPPQLADLSRFSGLAQDQELKRIATDHAQRPFDLTQCPLFRFCLVKLGDSEHVLLFTIHHIISDAWSLGIFASELAKMYRAYCQGKDSPLAELQIQYADYAVWQREWLQGGALEKQLAYWRKRLEGAPIILDLATDKPRPQAMSFRGAQQSLTLSKELTEALRALAQREQATLFMVLLAAFNVLLHRYSSQDDILVGCPVAGRNQVETESLIGFFVNTLVMRSDLSSDPPFRELLRWTKDNSLAAFANQDVPFEKLVHDLRPPRGVGHSPFFQAMMDFHGLSNQDVGEQDWRLQNVDVDRNTARADLLLFIEEQSDSLECLLEYSTDLFEPETISRMLRHLEVLLDGAVREPDTPISRLPLLTEQERRQLLGSPQVWHAGSPAALQNDSTTTASLHQLFEKQVELSPSASALVCGTETVTYRELNNRANQLADHLRQLGIRPEVLVGLCVERSIGLVVSVLGILKAGGAYLPLDPAYPADRVAFMIQDSQTTVLLTQEHLREKLPPDFADVLIIGDDGQVISKENCVHAGGRTMTVQADSRRFARDGHAETADGQNLAYVIYTSGSTGEPKGVLVTHHNVVRLFETTDSSFRFSKDDVWTLFHSYAFDFSVWELWGALLYGGRLVIVPYLVSRSPKDFYELIAVERVTVLNQTPSAFRQLSQTDLAENGGKELALRLIIFGGETLELNSLQGWFERHGDQSPQLVNMYGITETTVHVTHRPLKAADLANGVGSVIGSPLGDLRIYILDRQQQLVPLGVRGEMYVGGAGLGRGYLNRPALTADRFVPHEFSERPGARLYKTGDLARYSRNRDIEYLGRADRQVKIRGFRIELGEIEANLRRYAGVLDCVVTLQEDSFSGSQLVAYFIPATDRPPQIEALRDYLKERLPNHMVPALFVLLSKFPLTANGKIALSALPAPDKSRRDFAAALVGPRSDNEQKLADIWSEVLGRQEIGIHDNFFDLGGHSLLATQIMSRVREAFQVNLPLRYFFERPTVAGLAEFVGDAKKEERETIPPIRRLQRD